LEGDCNCPVGVLARIKDGKMKIRAQAFLGESAAPQEAETEGAVEDRERLTAKLLNSIGRISLRAGLRLGRQP